MSNVEVISPALEVRRLRTIIEEQRVFIDGVVKARNAGCSHREIVARVTPIEPFANVFSKTPNATVSTIGNEFSIIGKRYMVIAAPMAVNDGSTVLMCSMVMARNPQIADIGQFIADAMPDGLHNKAVTMMFSDGMCSVVRHIGSKKMYVARFYIDLWLGSLVPAVTL